MTALRTAALAVAFAAAGCAALVREETTPRAPTAFDLSGRVVVSYDGRAFSSGLRWQHLPERDEMWLLTPLGQALAHIVSSAEGATFTGADRRQYRGTDVESLSRQALGWELPLTRLQYWVRGETAPGTDVQKAERDGDRKLVRFVQGDWRISIAHYTEGAHRGLPRRLELARDSSQTIRLVIDEWRRDAGNE